ncbi:unnamed protein product [Notodromas monacha]|uniref:BTB domain-containing protein n=1 Tax=Notodromas monacha TaxID=399045 RepID=A0A7R9BIR9_9CRUS|nr:unnamed protein product [Notodromas monacha]CAG0914854.1 unnamed protein product [Notodromas monacha]
MAIVFEASNRDFVVVRQELEKLYNDPTFSDVKICCADLVINAHKVILSAVSPYFASMFKRVSKDLSALLLPDEDLPVVGIVLQYLYSGKVSVPAHDVDKFKKLAERFHVNLETEAAIPSSAEVEEAVSKATVVRKRTSQVLQEEVNRGEEGVTLSTRGVRGRFRKAAKSISEEPVDPLQQNIDDRKIDAIPGGAAGRFQLAVTRVKVPNADIHNMGELGCTTLERTPSPARLPYFSEKHPPHVLEEIQRIRKHRELCDVCIVVGSRRIFAHRVILSACSPYFRAMFTGELSESKLPEITIRDVDEQAMELLIDFCYSSKIVVEESNVQSLLPAACLLQLTEIQETCCEFLKRQLDPSNCLGIRAFADTHACRELLRIADRYTHHNFQEVMESEEFMLLPLNQLIDIISSDELNVRSEEQVFSAVMSWVKFNIPERRPHLAQILQHVRLPLLSPKFLVGSVGTDLLIRSDEACRDLVDEAKNYLLLPQERPLMQGPRTRPRRPTRRGEVLYAVGGWCSGDAIQSVERYDPQSNEWRMVAPMGKRRCGVGVAVLCDLLYAVGGHDGQSYLNSIERYDPQTNQWSSDVAPTSSCRTSVGVAVLDNFLYAVGGQDGVSCLNFVEKYDPNANRWTKVSSMSTRRLGVAVAVLGGYLYAIGGSDGTCPLNTVERYDPRTNRWTSVASMLTRRKHLGCAVYNNAIFAVGGRDDCMELSSAERYNPQTNQWSPIVAMNSRRSGVGLSVVNGLLYAVGGFDGTTYLKTVEVYDPDQNHAVDPHRVHLSSSVAAVATLTASMGALSFKPPQWVDDKEHNHSRAAGLLFCCPHHHEYSRFREVLARDRAKAGSTATPYEVDKGGEAGSPTQYRNRLRRRDSGCGPDFFRLKHSVSVSSLSPSTASCTIL